MQDIVASALLWRGSLLPLGCEAALWIWMAHCRGGCASSESKLPRHKKRFVTKTRSQMCRGLFQVATEKLLEPFAGGIAQHVFRRAFLFHQALVQE
jgi:hypothetical protein